MTSVRGRRAAGVASLLILLLVSACSDSRPKEAEGEKPAAPAFELERLSGPPLRLDEMRGKIVILDFWATWCAPCEVQMPVLDAIWKDADWRAEHADDLMIVGVSVDTDPPAEVAAWIEERGFEYPIGIGDQDLAMQYGIFGYPTLVVIDPAGGIHTRHMGVWSRAEIEEVLDEIRGLHAAAG